MKKLISFITITLVFITAIFADVFTCIPSIGIYGIEKEESVTIGGVDLTSTEDLFMLTGDVQLGLFAITIIPGASIGFANPVPDESRTDNPFIGTNGLCVDLSCALGFSLNADTVSLIPYAYIGYSYRKYDLSKFVNNVAIYGDYQSESTNVGFGLRVCGLFNGHSGINFDIRIGNTALPGKAVFNSPTIIENGKRSLYGKDSKTVDIGFRFAYCYKF